MLNVTRRRFLAQTAATGTAGLLPGLARAQTANQTPKRGGNLILGMDSGSATDSLDPGVSIGMYMFVTLSMFYDLLVNFDEKGALQPWLAESWEAKDAAKEWTFKLRSGVVFHNGQTMTSKDVVYSLNRHRGKDSKSVSRALFNDVTDIKATGPNEIQITLSQSNAGFPAILADYHICVGPEGSSFTDGIGTGAFALESFKPGVRTVARKNKNDWKSDRGYVDSVEILAINDSNSRISALLSGAVHIINRVDVNVLPQLQQNPAVQAFNTPSAGHFLLSMKSDAPPYDNPDLRLALKYGLDRESILKIALRGNGVIGNDQPISPISPYHAELPQRPYDPDKAKFHFKKSGFAGPVTFSIAPATFQNALSLAQIMQAGAAKAGIDIVIDAVPNDGYWANVYMKRPFFGGVTSGRPTPDLMFGVGYLTNSPWNEAFWKRPDFDKLASEARAELDEGKRKNIYFEMQKMVYEDGGELIPVFFNFIDGASAKLKGFVPSAMYQMSGWRAPEKVWFDT